MSRRPRDKYSKGHLSQGSRFPTAWSPWAWSPQHNCQSRWRLNGPEDYEYEYGPVQTQSSNLNSNPEQYTSSVNYTTDSVATITRGMCETTLDSTPQFPSHDTFIDVRNPGLSNEKFDPHYKVHHQRHFEQGKVFKVLWTEPTGNGGSEKQTESIRTGRFGEKLHEKVRRFVIIDVRDGHCLCMPINTYSNQGVNKYGVHASDHAVIHTYTDNPTYFDGEVEKGLTKMPIKFIPESARHKLLPASRLNYAKLYTVECNVKVWFIGRIHKDSEHQLFADYNIVHPPLTYPGMIPASTVGTTSSYAADTSSYQNPATYPATNTLYPTATSTYPAAGATYSSTPRSYTKPAYTTTYAPTDSSYSTDQSSLQPYGSSSVVGPSSYPASTAYDTITTASYAPVQISSFPNTSYPAGNQDLPQDQSSSTAQQNLIGYETDEELYGANEDSSHRKEKSSRRHRK